jgi:hypothetical protein
MWKVWLRKRFSQQVLTRQVRSERGVDNRLTSSKTVDSPYLTIGPKQSTVIVNRNRFGTPNYLESFFVVYSPKISCVFVMYSPRIPHYITHFTHLGIPTPSRQCWYHRTNLFNVVLDKVWYMVTTGPIFLTLQFLTFCLGYIPTRWLT